MFFCKPSFGAIRIDSVPFALREVEVLSYKVDKLQIQSNQLFLSNNLQFSSAHFSTKNYGLGQLSTFSYRGLSSENTTVLWEGIPIHSSMNGLIDLNLLPTSMTSQVQFSNENNRYGMGGQIAIQNKIPSSNQNQLSFRILSTNLYSGALVYGVSKTKWMMNTSTQVIFGKNNFDFVNTSNERTTLSHNSNWTVNHMTNMYWNFKKNTLQGALFVNSQAKDLPPMASSIYSSQSMQDLNVRLLIKYESARIKNSLSFHSENQSFTDSSIHLFAKHTGWSIKNVTNIQNIRILGFEVQFQQNQHLSWIKSSNYSSMYTLLELQQFVEARREFLDKKMTLHIGAKQYVTNYNVSIPLPFVQLKYQINQLFAAEYKASFNQRNPTLNEWFWNPGGNPNLQPEKGFSNAFSVSLSHQSMMEKWYVKTECFYNQMNQGIVWQPSSIASIWQPVNLKNYQNFGVSLDIEWVRKWNQWSFRNYASGQYLSSTNSDGFTSMYIPKWKVVYQGSVQFKSWEWKIESVFQSLRYTTTDNSALLPAYTIFNTACSYSFPTLQRRLKLTAGMDNVFDQNYQEIQNRPMPLRYFYFQIQIKL
jgi:iron complex outermembrane receptor protein